MNTEPKIEISKPEHSFPIQIFQGFLATFQAFKILNSHKKLWFYFIIPFIINLILLSAIFYLSYFYIYPFILSIIPAGDAWYLWLLRLIVGPIVVILLALTCVLLYSISGNIITAPFNDPLSAKVEELLSGKVFDEKLSFTGILKDIIRILKNTIKLLLFLIIFNIAILLFNFVPVIGNAVYSILSFLSVMFFFGFSFFDFPLERRKLDFGQKFKILWRFKFYSIGLGFSFSILSFIPILGFLVLNLSTIGAAELFVKYIDPNLKIEYRH